MKKWAFIASGFIAPLAALIFALGIYPVWIGNGLGNVGSPRSSHSWIVITAVPLVAFVAGTILGITGIRKIPKVPHRILLSFLYCAYITALFVFFLGARGALLEALGE